MAFFPITPRLASIPRSQLFTPSALTEISSLVGELDEVADKLRAVGSSYHRAVQVLSGNFLSVANAIEDGSANMPIMLDLRSRAENFDSKLEDIELDYARCQQSKQNSSYSHTVDDLAKALASVKPPSGTLPRHPSTAAIDEDQWGDEKEEVKPSKNDKSAIKVDVELVLKDLAVKNKALVNQLPRSNVQTYSVVKLPVVVAVHPYPDKKKLERLGFEVNDYEGYPVFQEQVLLAVRASYARQWDTNITDLADEIISAINASANTKLMMVSEIGRSIPHSPGFTYFWIMPSNYLSKLTPLMNALDEWSVPISDI